MAWRNDQVSEGETEEILRVARECLTLPDGGDFVEMGCYRGDTSLLLAEVVQHGARLWLYDSFEGLPEKTEADASVLGEEFRGGALLVAKREVKERFLRAGLAVPVIRKAWFSDLTVADMPEAIAFAFLDGDFYESIRDCLRLVEGLMVEGGVILVHDYGNVALPGVAKAVDEWLRGRTGVRTRRFESLVEITVGKRGDNRGDGEVEGD